MTQRAEVGAPDIRHAYELLFEWIHQQNYRGYDPYDGLLSQWKILHSNRLTRLGLVYLNKFSPINLRPVLAIRPMVDNQAIGLLVQAALRAEPKRTPVAWKVLVDEIKSASLFSVEGYHCWNGHPFPVQMRHYYRGTSVPEVIGTEACTDALILLFRRDPSATWIPDMLKSIRGFLLERLFTRYRSASHFRYSSSTSPHLCTYNASVIAARLVLDINAVLDETVGMHEVEEAFDFTISKQKTDGRWLYRINLDTGSEKDQVDFHQGFVLDAILRYVEVTGDPRAEEAYWRGLEFYDQQQFTTDGRSFHRVPRKWPTNIHYQAQGIVTFVNAARVDEWRLERAIQIARWTIKEMQNPRGYFEHLRFKHWRNRIPYMRWGNATMARALAELLAKTESADD